MQNQTGCVSCSISCYNTCRDNCSTSCGSTCDNTCAYSCLLTNADGCFASDSRCYQPHMNREWYYNMNISDVLHYLSHKLHNLLQHIWSKQ